MAGGPFFWSYHGLHTDATDNANEHLGHFLHLTSTPFVPRLIKHSAPVSSPGVLLSFFNQCVMKVYFQAKTKDVMITELRRVIHKICRGSIKFLVLNCITNNGNLMCKECISLMKNCGGQCCHLTARRLRFKTSSGMFLCGDVCHVVSVSLC